jgi:hypothetical protein
MGLMFDKWKSLKRHVLTEEKLDIITQLEASLKKSLCVWAFSGLAEVHLMLVQSCKRSSSQSYSHT